MAKQAKNKKLKMLVTGGAGFIGSHLVDALIEEGNDVVVIDNFSTGKRSQVNKKAKLVEADICDLKKIKPYFKGVDTVFHLGAIARIQPSIKNPIPTMNDNVMGTLNVFLSSRDAKVRRIVYSASSSSYGDQETLPLHEDMVSRFKSPYALSKYVGEELCRLFSSLYGVETVSLRYFNVYGPRQLLSGAYATVAGIFLKQRNDGKPLTIVGDGTIRRDFTNVFDVVRANILASKSNRVGRGEMINIGTGKNYSINEVAVLILSKEAAPKKLSNILDAAIKAKKVVYIPPRPGETKKTLANTTKARQLLNWKPTIAFEDGLAMLKKDI